jgi:prolipoprotein diacylglyceryltransferase
MFLLADVFQLPRQIDIITPAIALGQAIGRWELRQLELYEHQRICLEDFIEPQNRLPEFRDQILSPLFLYESLWNC